MKALAALLLWGSAAEAACRQALVLALDISGSVDDVEYRQQMDGVAIALTSPAVRAVLLAEGSAPVQLAVFEWSGPVDQTIVLPWTAITDAVALDGVAATLYAHRRSPGGHTTGIGPAMLTAFDLLSQQPACWKHTLDISGDGEANNGPLPQTVSLETAPAGTTVNALVIGAAYIGTDPFSTDDLVDYFAANVIRGEGAFVEPAASFDDYAEAMERKLLRELQSIALSAR